MVRNESVAEAFAGKTILLTGASGFVGKAVVEKLLRTCPRVQRVYVVLRSRKGKSHQERLQDILSDPAFYALRSTDASALAKVVAVAGDCAELKLGLSAEDRGRLCEEVNVFVHAAASVRFDDSVRQAVLLNTRGTREVAVLAMDMQKLEGLVHVSTTYCNTDRRVVEEQVYTPAADWRQVVRAAEEFSEQELQNLDMGYHPNTYTFSKALAEQVMYDHADKITIAIIRPSTVVPAAKEPVPGWLSNLNGPLALCVGITKGLVHTTLVNENVVTDFIPLEMAVNGIILAAHDCIRRSAESDGGIRVFNGGAANKKTMKIGELIRCAVRASKEDPHDQILWQPFVVMTSSKVLFTVFCILFHFFPGLLLDTALRLAGRKPWFIRTYSKIYKATLALQYFTFNEWIFKNDNFFRLLDDLTERDRSTYDLDYSNLQEDKYLRDTMRYIRQHILKENMDAGKAKRYQRIMYCLDRVVRALLFYCFGGLLYRGAVGLIRGV